MRYRISPTATNEFKALDGQSKPEGGLLERIFRNARFDTRFYEEVQVYEKQGVGNGKFYSSVVWCVGCGMKTE